MRIFTRSKWDVVEAAATAAIIHYYGRHPEDLKADDTPFVVNTVPESKAWQINDKQRGISSSVQHPAGSTATISRFRAWRMPRRAFSAQSTSARITRPAFPNSTNC